MGYTVLPPNDAPTARSPLRHRAATTPFPTRLRRARTFTVERFRQEERAQMRTLTLIAVVVAAAGAAGTAGAVPTKHSSTTLVGAGSSFVAPLVSQWVPAVSAAYGYELQYSPIGSGGGINAITGRTVDFGASDAPLSSDQFAACKGCFQIPCALSATSVFYNLSGVQNPLHMDGPTLAKIFMGHI